VIQSLTESNRELLVEAVRILQSKACRSDPCRLARSQFKLSLVLDHLNDPAAQAAKKEAYDLVASVGVSCTDEASFDALVSYV
jgi:hypothetical protein